MARFEGGWLSRAAMGIAAISVAGELASVSPAASQETGQAPITVRDFIGCWRSTGPSGIIIRTDYNKPDGYKAASQEIMLSFDPVGGGPEYSELVNSTLDVWSESEGFYIPSQYLSGVFDPVAKSVIIGAPDQGNSTNYRLGDQLVMVHHKATETSADNSLRYLKKISCEAMKERRDELHSTLKLNPE
ncbi:hypothetical protein [Roseibium sp. RKSG952]|uniref:hypothetical protein n=1 Tax=Roseibium sp. RKSG952 TaxID=2529384 RepID=UPI0012BC293C|nr:hypothetical protein [Roseibium sp. RKSG952]MTH94929.1 hypothetical protein [Roseibium sp. RKSG952]